MGGRSPVNRTRGRLSHALIPTRADWRRVPKLFWTLWALWLAGVTVWLLASCAAAPDAGPLPIPPVIAAPAPAPAPAPPSHPSAAIRATYQAAVTLEASAVLSPNATPAYVARVIAADRHARVTLAPLERVHPPASHEQMQAAATAVGALQAIVEAGP